MCRKVRSSAFAQTVPETISCAASSGAVPNWHRQTSQQLALDALEQGLAAAKARRLQVDNQLAAALRSAMRSIPLGMQDLVPGVYHRLPLDLESTAVLSAPATPAALPAAPAAPPATAPATTTATAENNTDSEPEPALPARKVYSLDDLPDDLYVDTVQQTTVTDSSVGLFNALSPEPDAGQGRKYSHEAMALELAHIDRVLAENATWSIAGGNSSTAPLSSTPADGAHPTRKPVGRQIKYDSDSGTRFISLIYCESAH